MSTSLLFPCRPFVPVRKAISHIAYATLLALTLSACSSGSGDQAQDDTSPKPSSGSSNPSTPKPSSGSSNPNTPKPIVNSIRPTTAIVGKQTTFEIRGAHFPEDIRIRLDGATCLPAQRLSDDQYNISCTSDSNGTLAMVVEQAGVTLKSQSIVFNQPPPVVQSISPDTLYLGKATEFTLQGSDLNETVVSIEGGECQKLALDSDGSYKVKCTALKRLGSLPLMVSANGKEIKRHQIQVSLPVPQSVTVTKPKANSAISIAKVKWAGDSELNERLGIAYTVYSAKEPITQADISNIKALWGGESVDLAGSRNGISIILNNYSNYYFAVATRLSLDSSVKSSLSNSVYVARGALALNDTGSTDCIASDGSILSCDQVGINDSNFGQDGHHYTGFKTASGDYLRGKRLKHYYDKDDAGEVHADGKCIVDEHTGLMWEIKSAERYNLRDKEGKYSWESDDYDTNGGVAGGYEPVAGFPCHGLNKCSTQEYVTAVNALRDGKGLCGFSDWRLPTREELRSIVEYVPLEQDRQEYATYFPNMKFASYWTSSSYAADANKAWVFNMAMSGDEVKVKKAKKAEMAHVRLVRVR